MFVSCPKNTIRKKVGNLRSFWKQNKGVGCFQVLLSVLEDRIPKTKHPIDLEDTMPCFLPGNSLLRHLDYSNAVLRQDEEKKYERSSSGQRSRGVSD